ncbi:MAG TPA: hypothetical protein VM100_03830 [Longimicrobiales bacterium]|nr:hypothetical protein [Longimicrobiales bacterium]
MMPKYMLLLSLGLASCASAQRGDRELNAITSPICDKALVVLGELPSHGEAKTFVLKARLVQDLVQNCGFNVVAFEAPIYDFLAFTRASDTTQLNNAIGRFWLANELGAFRRWLFTEATAGRLNLVGLDDQLSITSKYGRAILPTLMATAECREIVARNLQWTYTDAQPFDATEKERLRGCVFRASSNDIMLKNLRTFVDRQVDAPGARSRDDVFRENLRRQTSRGSKAIVWTATVHADRRAWGPRAATIGFTALSGSSSMAGRPVKQFEKLPEDALESHVEPNGEWTFLDARKLKGLGVVPSRLLGKVTSAEWSSYFDGVVVFRAEVAPTFPKW